MLRDGFGNGRISRRTLAKAAAGAAAIGVASPAFARRAGAQETTLTVWDSWTRDVDSALIEQLNQEFMEANPGVTIERVVKGFDDLKATAKLAMSSDDGPDLVQINQGLSDMGAMAKAGILTSLDDYAEQYGWKDKLSAGMIARHSFAEDGTVFGEGVFYGMPLTAEFIGVYYNKQKFADAGIEIPQTFADLEAALQTLQAAGEAPIVFGNLEAWPAIHTYGEIQGLYVDTAYLDDFIFGRNDVSFETPENIQAAAKLQEWVAAGYFTPDFSGIGYDDSWAQFKSGTGALMITGSWISGELATSEDPAFGFFLFPAEEAGDVKPVVAGTSMAYAIRQGSPNADLAASYIDFLVSDRAAEGFSEVGIVPIGVDPEKVTEDTLYADVVAAWTQINTTDAAGHYLDWATPTFYDTITAGLTELLANAVTPEEFAAKLQADYGAFIAGS